MRRDHRGPECVHAAVDDLDALVPPPRTQCATARVSVRGIRRRIRLRRCAEAAAGQTLGRRQHHHPHHAQDARSPGRGTVVSLVGLLQGSWRSVALATAVVAASSAWVLFSGIDRAPFHGDESGWISSGMYYSDLLLASDFSREKWECGGCKTWGALNGHVGKLLIGASYFTCDASNPCTFSGYYDFFMSFEENQRRGQVPPEHILRRGRYSAAIAGVICSLLAFAVGYRGGEPKLLVGILWSGLLLATPIFRLFANRAMADAFYNLFLLTQLLAAVAIVKSGDERNMIRRLGVAGMLTGLTASVKPSGFLLGVPLFLAVAAYRLGVGSGYKRPENGRVFILSVMT